MKSFISHIIYAILAFIEGCVVLLTLGYYTPPLTINYLCWNGKRKAMKRKMENVK